MEKLNKIKNENSSEEYQKLMTKVILISATVYNQFWEKILRLQI